MSTLDYARKDGHDYAARNHGTATLAQFRQRVAKYEDAYGLTAGSAFYAAALEEFRRLSGKAHPFGKSEARKVKARATSGEKPSVADILASWRKL